MSSTQNWMEVQCHVWIEIWRLVLHKPTDISRLLSDRDLEYSVQVKIDEKQDLQILKSSRILKKNLFDFS